MAKFVIGKTPEQLEQEEANFLRQREAEVIARNQEQEKNLRMMVAKNKRNKLIVLVTAIIIILALLIFGTYNTFLRHELNQDDVLGLVNNAVVIFEDTGLPGFLADNFETWYSKNVNYSEAESTVAYVKPLTNTIAINEIKVVNRLLARVYFSIDIESKEKDYKGTNGEMITGATTITRSKFYIPVEYHYNLNSSGQAVSVGYAAVGPLSYCMLESTDTADILENDFIKMSGDLVDEETLNSAKIKVDKILKDLYDGADTSQDYRVPRPFVNTNGDSYEGLVSFSMYVNPNALGYNTVVTYSIQTKEGYKYLNTAYLSVAQNGTTWTINGWM